VALRGWIHQLNTTTGDKNVRKKITVTTQNLGPSVILRSMHVITDTLTMGPLVSCVQDILIHGQDIRSVRKSIGDINPDYQVFSDTGSFVPDDFRKLNYAGWGASGLASLTLLNKRAFDIPNCKIHEWRNDKELKGRLGRGRILWIKARTLSGKSINIVNVYQATVDKPEMSKRIYEALTRALNAERFIPKNTWGSNRNKNGNEYKQVSSSTPSMWLRKFVSGRVININSLRSAFISYWWNKLNSNEKEILVVRMRTSKRETENNYRKDYTDTDTLTRVKLEPTDDLLEQAYTGSGDRPIDVENRALPVVNIENISLNPNVAISRDIPINQVRTLLSQRPRKVRKDARGQDSHTRRYENWIRWYEKGNNKQRHNAAT
jgi:hypothetical protein